MNVTNLGNDSVNARLTNFASMIPVFRAININNVGNRTSSNSVDYYGLGLSKYSDDADIDSLFNDDRRYL